MRLPNGSTANISPHVISHGRLARAGRRADEVLPQPAGVGVGRVDAGVLPPHRVGHHVAHLGLVQPGRVAQDVVGLRADHLVAQHRGLRVGVVDDRLDVGTSRDAERLGDPGRAAGPRDVAAAHHQLEHGVRRTGVDALGDEDVAAHQVRHAVGVADDHRVDGRVLERVGDVEDRSLPRGPRRVADRVAAQRGALVDDDDLDLDALPAQPLGLGLDPGRLVEELQSLRGAGRDELRGLLEPGADHADLHAVDPEHRRRRDPVRCLSGVRVDDVGREEREVGPRLVLRAAGRRRSRTRGCRTTWRRGPRRSPRRSPACPRAAPSSGERRRRCRRRPGSGPRPGRAARSSSNIVARKAAPPTRALMPSSYARVVGSS